MIEKFLKIISVGRFGQYKQPVGDLAFKKLTLFFGENGHGKSTLSTIFKSLKNGDVNLLKERSTLGRDEPQEIQIRYGGNSTISFDGKKWSSILPQIEIFDQCFVNQNVYAGDSIEHGHKKQLYRFAIGEEAVSIC